MVDHFASFEFVVENCGRTGACFVLLICTLPWQIVMCRMWSKIGAHSGAWFVLVICRLWSKIGAHARAGLVLVIRRLRSRIVLQHCRLKHRAAPRFEPNWTYGVSDSCSNKTLFGLLLGGGETECKGFSRTSSLKEGSGLFR